jgi:hypothetical protein
MSLTSVAGSNLRPEQEAAVMIDDFAPLTIADYAALTTDQRSDGGSDFGSVVDRLAAQYLK